MKLTTHELGFACARRHVWARNSRIEAASHSAEGAPSLRNLGPVGDGFSRLAPIRRAPARLLATLTLTPGGFRLALGIGALGGGLSVWLVRRFSPEASGSGIPHLKTVVLGERQMTWRRLLPVKFIAGVCGIGGGLALGREGPTIQMGGATGIMVSEWFKIRPGEGERRALISAGAGAGLAAAFNAPLAGMIFVLEELQGNFTPVVFVAAFLASVAAAGSARLRRNFRRTDLGG